MKCIRQSDGTLVTEKKKTTEHEDIIDKDLPDGDNQSTGSQEKILKHKVSRCGVFNPIIIHAIYDMSSLSHYFRSVKLINE